jgi:hypothetical protein
MARISGGIATVFHNVFHSFCEDPAAAAGDVT